MLKTLILFSTLFVSNLRQIDVNVQNSIYKSHIPNDCKKLFVALTIFESNCHDNRRSIVTTNYSGFMYKGRLKRFKSVKHYTKFVEKWFKRKHIRNRKQFVSLILRGKYAHLSKNNCKKYLKKLVSIEKSL